jgi:hypothetical protein
MAEIAIPLTAAPRRLQANAVRARLRMLIASRPPREPPSRSYCFGRLGAKDAMVARGLTAAAVVERGALQQ